MKRRVVREPLRLFVAAYPSRGLVEALTADLPPAYRLDSRKTPTEQVHLTLQFIGETELIELPRVRESVERSCAGLCPFDLIFERLMTFPPGGKHTKLLAATTNAPPTLLEIHRRLAHRLAKNVRQRQEERFHPHVTVARFPTRVEPYDVPLPGLTWVVDSVLLMESILHPSGAEHRELGRFELTREG
jgi:2'-5' RNA ligase